MAFTLGLAKNCCKIKTGTIEMQIIHKHKWDRKFFLTCASLNVVCLVYFNRHVELNWSIKFDLSATIAWRLNQHFDCWIKLDKLCRATWLVWHWFKHRTKLVILYIIPADLSDFTLVRHFNQCYLAQLIKFDIWINSRSTVELKYD